MRIQITIEVDDTDRYAIAHFYGQRGKASREDMEQFLQSSAETELADVRSDFEQIYYEESA